MDVAIIPAVYAGKEITVSELEALQSQHVIFKNIAWDGDSKKLVVPNKYKNLIRHKLELQLLKPTWELSL